MDVVLHNVAPFPQPYPDIKLILQDVDLRTIAERRFQSREYLGSNIPENAFIPSNQPVHITFDFVDPGENAVNFNAVLLPNSESSSS